MWVSCRGILMGFYAWVGTGRGMRAVRAARLGTGWTIGFGDGGLRGREVVSGPRGMQVG